MRLPTSNHADPERVLRDLAWTRRLAAALVADSALADDVTQDTWLAAVRKYGPDGAPARAWLRTVLLNFVRRRARDESTRRRREGAGARREATPSVAESLERFERERQLVELLAALPENLRTVVLLRFVDGLTPLEIARRLDVPGATVRSWQRRALERLREELDRREGGRERWLAGWATFARNAEPRRVLPWLTAKTAGLAAAWVVMCGSMAVLFLGEAGEPRDAAPGAVPADAHLVSGIGRPPGDEDPADADPGGERAKILRVAGAPSRTAPSVAARDTGADALGSVAGASSRRVAVPQPQGRRVVLGPFRFEWYRDAGGRAAPPSGASGVVRTFEISLGPQ